MPPATRSRGLLQPLSLNTQDSKATTTAKDNKTKAVQKKKARKPPVKRGLLEEFETEATANNVSIDSLVEGLVEELDNLALPEEEPPLLPSAAAARIIWKHDDFQVLGDLGEGATSRVVQAAIRDHTLTNNDNNNRKLVAIKMMDYTLNTRYADRELSIHSSLPEHTNIVALLGHYFLYEDTTKTHLCLVLEYCSQTLLDLVQKEEKLSEAQAAPIVAQTVQALLFLHQRGIMHRDVKLANILLTSRDEEETADTANNTPSSWIVKLADFGISKPTTPRNPKDRRHTIVGTNAYMAPEVEANTSRTVAGQALWDQKKPDTTAEIVLPPAGVDLYDSTYTTQVDVWSLGVTLHAMVTGLIPGERNNDDDDDASDNSDFDFCFGNDVLGDGVYDIEIPEDLSAGCTDLLTGMLQDDPKDRLTLEQIQNHPWLVGHGCGGAC